MHRVRWTKEEGNVIEGDLHWELTAYGKLYMYVGSEPTPLVVYEDCTIKDVEDATNHWVFEDFGLLIWDSTEGAWLP